MTNSSIPQALHDALWRIYRRVERPAAWTNEGNLPWNDPAFSKRMLTEHLDETHSAASRTMAERTQQIDWLWNKLTLGVNAHLLDITCGPGLYATALAQKGCTVTGIDFGPAAIEHAQKLARHQGVSMRCHFLEEDIRKMLLPSAKYDAAIFLYGQLAVLPREQAKIVLQKIARSLKTGSKLCIELLNPQHVDKSDSSWWFTDDTGLWGDKPFLHLGERFWDEGERCSTERYTILQLETGLQKVIHLSDQMYSTDEIIVLLKEVGFSKIDLYAQWDTLALYDAEEWNVFVATK